MAAPINRRFPPGSVPRVNPQTVDPAEHQFIKPKREVLQPPDVKTKWEKSQAYYDLIGFMTVLSDAVRMKRLSDSYELSENTKKIMSLLEEMDSWIDEIPPIDQPQRFGNTAFRDWFKRLDENAGPLLSQRLDENLAPAVEELSVYLIECVGNSTRIDYGTGHELVFVAFLYCLYRVGFLTSKDYVATVFSIFNRYIELMRRLQTVYMMEPAGSHGVWSLDDYQFLPFYFGSSQLIDHPSIFPADFVEMVKVDQHKREYMFFQGIDYINTMKTGPFFEHSNQLWGISGVQLWSKVNTGLMKMYKAEVLAKFPIIQHFLFGSLLTIAPPTSPAPPTCTIAPPTT